MTTGGEAMSGPERNSPCPCGSGKKYKKCCGAGSPDSGDSDHLLTRATQAFEAGRLAEALSLCRTFLQRLPGSVQGHHLCGLVFYQSGDAGQARRHLEQALRLEPDNALMHSNLALILQKLGDLDAAECHGRRAVALDPALADAHNNLGNVLKAKGLTDEAIGQCRAATTADPDNPLFLVNLGSLLQLQGLREQAEEAYRRALAFAPAWAPLHANLGALYLEAKRYQEAETTLHQALTLTPDDSEVLNNLGLVMQGQGRLEEALEWFRRAIGKDPRHAGAHSNLGLVLEEMGESEQAILAYEQAVACNPEFYPAHQNLLGILVGLGQVDRAHPLACALLERPHAEIALPVAIDVFGQACDFKRRARAWRVFDDRWRAGRIAPATLAKALFSGNYESDLSEERLFDYHRAWGKWVESRAPVTEVMGVRSRSPGERLRVAYLSPDFRQHPVGYFIQHVIAAHDRARFEVFCYSNARKRDDLTDFIRAHTDRFTTVAGHSDEALARAVRDDGVDILVDLAGHTSGNRLPVLVLRPAPLQMTWIGYLNTTGLSGVDYRISDPYADPEERVLGTERLLRLPECFLSFGGFPAGAVDPLPACLRHGHVTFASFNNLMKLTAPAVRLWADILKRVDGSRLVVMAVGAGSQTVRAHLSAELAGHGVDPERLVLEESLSREAYFDFHNAIDVMLDSFPYNGGTVTCGALWMGVPVVTYVGPAHRQRVSYSLLKNVGLDETIAWDDRQYVETAVRLAGDPAILARLRRELPDRLRASVLCDTARFTRHLEAAYLKAWEERVATGRHEPSPSN